MARFPVNWNFSAILDRLGTIDEAVQAFVDAGLEPPSRETISMWRYRRRIGPEWTAGAIYALKETGRIKDVRQLIATQAPL
jgi:hypothetical protein